VTFSLAHIRQWWRYSHWNHRPAGMYRHLWCLEFVSGTSSRLFGDRDRGFCDGCGAGAFAM